MSDFRRNRVSGGTYFFTVNLLERRSRLLVEHIDVLREAVRITKHKLPFHINAWMVLPEHSKLFGCCQLRLLPCR
jgi:putative transposase